MPISNPNTRKPNDRRERRTRYDSEAAADSVHLVAETQSLALVPDLPAPDPRQLTKSDPAARRAADNVSVEPDADGVSGLLGGFP